MEMKTFLVINETRRFCLMFKRVEQLLDLLKGSESKNWRQDNGFRGTNEGFRGMGLEERMKLYFAAPAGSLAFQCVVVLVHHNSAILRACLKSKNSLECNF